MTTPQLKDYVRATRDMIAPGAKLQVDLYLYMPLNNTLLHFRRKGDVLSKEDLESLRKIPDANLLIPRSQIAAHFEKASSQISTQIKAGNIESKEVKSAASSALGKIEPTSPLGGAPSGEVARQMMQEAPKMVETIITGFKKTRSAESYDHVLRSFKSAQDDLTNHQRQVGALAVLIQLAVGGGSVDDLADLGTAGMVHDLGMASVSKELALRHIHGEPPANPKETTEFLDHVNRTLATLEKNRVQLTPGAMRIIQHHHENWDGSGFNKLVGMKIYRPARILRIADEAVAFIDHPKRHAGFKNAILDLSTRRGATGEPLFDPQIIEALLNSDEISLNNP